MHRLRAWGFAALLAALGGAAAFASDADDAPPQPISPFNGTANPAFRRWAGAPAEKPKPPPPLPTTVAATRRAAETAGALRAQEEANFLRRQAVCDKLREVASETNDEALEKRAYELEEKAQRVFRQRTQAIAAGRDLSKSEERGAKK